MLRVNEVLGIFYCLGIIVGLNCHWSTEGEPGRRNGVTMTIFVMSKEFLELAILTWLYLNVRPRIWPNFFSLEVGVGDHLFHDVLGEW